MLGDPSGQGCVGLYLRQIASSNRVLGGMWSKTLLAVWAEYFELNHFTNVTVSRRHQIWHGPRPFGVCGSFQTGTVALLTPSCWLTLLPQRHRALTVRFVFFLLLFNQPTIIKPLLPPTVPCHVMLPPHFTRAPVFTTSVAKWHGLLVLRVRPQIPIL